MHQYGVLSNLFYVYYGATINISTFVYTIYICKKIILKIRKLRRVLLLLTDSVTDYELVVRGPTGECMSSWKRKLP